MRLLWLVLMFGLTLPQASQAGFAGTWLAELDRVVFVKLEMRATNGSLAGTIALGNVHVDRDGVVDRASAAPTIPTPLLDVVVRDAVVSFARQEGNDLEQFRLRVVGENTAELTFLPSEEGLLELKEQGIAALKPIPLRKAR